MEELTKKELHMQRRQEKLEAKDALHKVKMLKKYALWGAVFAIFIAMIVGIVVAAPKLARNQTAALSMAVNAGDWFEGGAVAKAVLVEYSDFQCPACAAYAPLVKSIAGEFGDNLKVVYRHFPLPQHLNAALAAQAAEAAGLQGKFWEMHDLIFANQSNWAEAGDAKEIFAGFAAGLGMDGAKFRQDMESKAVKDAVAEDLQSGQASRINSTPTFFLNGKKIVNPRSAAEFRTLISQALSE